MSPLAAGIALLPLTVSSVAGPLVGYRWLARYAGPAAILALGFGLVLVGAAILLVTLGNPAYVEVAAVMILIGGLSTVCFSALTRLLLSSTPAELIGVGSGLQNTTRQGAAALAPQP